MKIVTIKQEIDMGKAFISKMETDNNYFKEYKEERIVSLKTIGESAGEDLRRELHRISRTNRSKDRIVLGSYIGLNLFVRSDYS